MLMIMLVMPIQMPRSLATTSEYEANRVALLKPDETDPATTRDISSSRCSSAGRPACIRAGSWWGMLTVMVLTGFCLYLGPLVYRLLTTTHLA